LKYVYSRNLKIVYSLLAVLLIWTYSANRLFAQCTPQSAYLIGSADDLLTVYVNGSAYGPISYVNAGTGSPVQISIPAGAFLSTGNIIAAVNTNTAPSVVESSWVIDVTCTNGQHSYFTSNDFAGKANSMYDDTACTGPPATNGGFQWYQPGWNAAGVFTGSPTQVTGAPGQGGWLQQFYSPQNGQLMPFISDNNTGTSTSGCQSLYYRGTFNLNPQVVTPPTFSISKSGPVSVAQSFYLSGLSYALTICNSGQATSLPVTIADNMPAGASYGGPYPTYNPTTGQMYTAAGGTPALFIFPAGFPGNGACVTIPYTMALGDTTVAPCQRVNTASVTWNGAVQASATHVANIIGCGATPTFTPTNSFTNTFTPTNTNTPTNTFTRTNTPTNTNTNSPTNTFTNTPTRTNTPEYVRFSWFWNRRSPNLKRQLVYPRFLKRRGAGFPNFQLYGL